MHCRILGASLHHTCALVSESTCSTQDVSRCGDHHFSNRLRACSNVLSNASFQENIQHVLTNLPTAPLTKGSLQGRATLYSPCSTVPLSRLEVEADKGYMTRPKTLHYLIAK